MNTEFFWTTLTSSFWFTAQMLQVKQNTSTFKGYADRCTGILTSFCSLPHRSGGQDIGSIYMKSIFIAILDMPTTWLNLKLHLALLFIIYLSF